MLFEKIRYNIIFKLIKIMTPSFRLGLEKHFVIHLIDMSFVDLISKIPRPSIIKMKEYFLNREVVGVELGVLKGDNAKSILKELNIKKLYLIDSWHNYIGDYNKLEIIKNYRKVLRTFKDDNRVSIIKGKSSQVVKTFDNESLDFIYIDANHKYDYVYQDLNNWSKKIKLKGFIAGHDICNSEGVFNALLDWSYLNHIDYKITIPDWYFIKRKNI